MYLEAYPFDKQKCVFNIRLSAFTRDYVSFDSTGGKNIRYEGTTNLREYAVSYINMQPYNFNNYNGRKITIFLDNMSGFYISTTYVPSFLMVAICYLTFYFDMDDFNDRIMVSLTALLVLATLFTQLTDTTPKTPYLKLLDIWFVSTIFICFSIVTILVIINYIKLWEDYNQVINISRIGMLQKKSWFGSKTRISVKINTLARLILPIIEAIFFVIYVLMSVNMLEVD